MEMTTHEVAVIETMRQYGTSFAQALASAWLKADSRNWARLREAFLEEYHKYESILANNRETDNELQGPRNSDRTR